MSTCSVYPLPYRANPAEYFAAIRHAPGAVLLDSVTALLSNEMFRADGTMDASAPARLEAELLEFSRRMRCCVFVSDYIYADGG